MPGRKWRDITDFKEFFLTHCNTPPSCPAVLESLSHDDFRLLLDRLKLLLDNLPRQLLLKSAANSAFSTFLYFELDPDLLEKTGCEVSALNETLKGVFGWKARTTGDGIIPIEERGPAACAMHKVLLEFWSRHPENNVLRKWIFDILKGVEKVYTQYNIPVRNLTARKIRTVTSFYNLKIAGSEFTTETSAQKRDRSESVAAEIPKAKAKKIMVGSVASENAVFPLNFEP